MPVEPIATAAAALLRCTAANVTNARNYQSVEKKTGSLFYVD
jgi:hypothetical protein